MCQKRKEEKAQYPVENKSIRHKVININSKKSIKRLIMNNECK